MRKRFKEGKGFYRAIVITILIGAALGICGCPLNLEQSVIEADCEPEQLPPGAVGSWENPIKCYMPEGEMAYMERLRGPDGERVQYRRTGSVGQGVHGNMVDRYIVQSWDGSVCVEVFMDMYIRGYREDQPIKGFTLAH